jgi:ribosomal protein L22
MEDKNIPEENTLQSLLQKANVEPHLYERALKLMKSGIGIKLQRQPSERWINQYNPKILQTWRANMDLQFITDPHSCIMYITSYMMKSERAMSELLKKVANDAEKMM